MDDQGLSRRNLGGVGLGVAVAAATLPAMADAAPAPAALTAGNWMNQVKAQHAAISAGFAATRGAKSPVAMKAAFRNLADLLTAHSIAEEVALYPGIAIEGDKASSDRAYQEQQEAKVLVARIDGAMMKGDRATAMSTLATLEQAITAHVREEEDQWYPALMKKADARMNAKMTADFRRAFSRDIA